MSKNNSIYGDSKIELTYECPNAKKEVTLHFVGDDIYISDRKEYESEWHQKTINVSCPLCNEFHEIIL
jgi:hypothetical protein